MKKILKLVLSLLLLLYLGCKDEQNKKLKKSLKEPAISSVKNEKSRKLNNYTLEDFQGIWTSYSYYLEHESEFKDFNKHKYYKIISGKTVLDIRLPDQNLENSTIHTYDFGFLDMSNKKIFASKESFIKNLQNSGNTLVRLERNNKAFDISNIEISTKFMRNSDVTENIDDGFKYDDKTHQLHFRILNALPKNIFIKLKEKSVIDNIDYLEKIKHFKISEKGKIKAEKTFFHNDTIKETKRKAFLVKGDIVYIESTEGPWLKVYYDGKIVSGGYIQKSDIEVLVK